MFTEANLICSKITKELSAEYLLVKQLQVRGGGGGGLIIFKKKNAK